MISFNSLVALVISCSSAATAWRFPGGAAREPSRSSTLITYSSGSMAPKVAAGIAQSGFEAGVPQRRAPHTSDAEATVPPIPTA